MTQLLDSTLESYLKFEGMFGHLDTTVMSLALDTSVAIILPVR